MRKKPRKTNARPLALESLETRLTMSGFGMRTPDANWSDAGWSDVDLSGPMMRGEFHQVDFQQADFQQAEIRASAFSRGELQSSFESEFEVHAPFDFGDAAFDDSNVIPHGVSFGGVTAGPEFREANWGGVSWTPVSCCRSDFPGGGSFLASGGGVRGDSTFADRSIREPAEGEFSAPNSISNNGLSAPIVVVLDRPESSSVNVIVFAPIVTNLARPDAIISSGGRDTASGSTPGSTPTRTTTLTDTPNRVTQSTDSVNRGVSGQESIVRDTGTRDTAIRVVTTSNGNVSARTVESSVVGAIASLSSTSSSLVSTRDSGRSASNLNWSVDLLASTNFTTSVLTDSRLATGLDASVEREVQFGANRLESYDPFADGEGWWSEESDGVSDSATDSVSGQQSDVGTNRTSTRDSRNLNTERGKSMARRDALRGAEGVSSRRKIRDNSDTARVRGEQQAAPTEAQADGMVALAHRVRGRRLSGAPTPAVPAHLAGASANAVDSQLAGIEIGQRAWVRGGNSVARNQSFEIGLSGANAGRSVSQIAPSGATQPTSFTSDVSSAETGAGDSDANDSSSSEGSSASSSWWMKLCVGLMTLSVIWVRRRKISRPEQA